jgi:hypothetical protein
MDEFMVAYEMNTLSDIDVSEITQLAAVKYSIY